MLKVIFKVQKLVLKCKNISCQILAKKESHTVHLSSLRALRNGEALIEEQTEFLIVQNDPTFHIQVCLVSQQFKKLGGQVYVNIVEWDEGVHHSTVAALKNSPDRNSLISYTFLYIRKDFLKAQKSLILCSQYRNHDLASMENEKSEMTKRQQKLEAQIKTLKSRKQTLKNNDKMRSQQISIKKKDCEDKMKSFQEKINENTIKNDNLKKRNEEIVRMIQLYGKEEIKIQLEKKYPETNQSHPGNSEQKSIENQEDLLGKGNKSQIRRNLQDRQRSREKDKGYQKR